MRTYRAVSVVLLLVTMSSSAALSNDRKARINAEWEKFKKQATNVCFEGGGVYFVYSVLDSDGQPKSMPPSFPTDLMKKAATSLPLSDELRSAFAGPINAAINHNLEKLRDGTYNTMWVRFHDGGDPLVITPAKEDSDELLLWIPRSRADRILDQLARAKAADTIYTIGSEGTVLPFSARSKPSWMISESSAENIVTNFRMERQRSKNFIKCK